MLQSRLPKYLLIYGATPHLCSVFKHKVLMYTMSSHTCILLKWPHNYATPALMPHLKSIDARQLFQEPVTGRFPSRGHMPALRDGGNTTLLSTVHVHWHLFY